MVKFLPTKEVYPPKKLGNFGSGASMCILEEMFPPKLLARLPEFSQLVETKLGRDKCICWFPSYQSWVNF